MIAAVITAVFVLTGVGAYLAARLSHRKPTKPNVRPIDSVRVDDSWFDQQDW